MRPFLLLLLCLSCSLSAIAETLYLSDQLRLPMRKGGGGSYKISQMLPSGSLLEILGVDGHVFQHFYAHLVLVIVCDGNV